MDGLNKHDGNDRQKSQWTWRQTKQEREKGLKKKKTNKQNRAYGPVRQYLKVKHTGNWSHTATRK